MNQRQQDDFGTWIRLRREERGLSLKQISEVIRIDARYLRALETGNIILLPEPYMRAFLKTYASHLGLDTEEAARRFEAFLKAQAERQDRVRSAVREKEGRRNAPSAAPAPAGIATDPPPKIEPAPAAEGGRGLWLALLVLLLFAGVGYGAVRVFDLFPGLTGGTAAAKDPGPGGQTRVPAAPDTQAVPEPPDEQVAVLPEPTPATPAPGRHVFAVTAVEEVWIQAVSGGDTLLNRVMRAGQSVRVVFADTLRVRMGKNLGARLFLDGSELEDMGPDGYILSRLVLTGSGILERRLSLPPDRR